MPAQATAPALVSLYKTAGVSLRKQGLDGRRAAVWDLRAYTGKSQLTLPRMRLDPVTRPANGLQPLVGTLPESLGFHVVRDTSKPFQGLHPSGKGQPVPGAPRPR